MGELIDDRDLGLAGEDRVEVRLFEEGALVWDHAARDDLEVADPGGGLGAAVRLDQGDDDVNPAPPHRVGVVEHLERLADARSLADVDLQVSALRIPVREPEK